MNIAEFFVAISVASMHAWLAARAGTRRAALRRVSVAQIEVAALRQNLALHRRHSWRRRRPVRHFAEHFFAPDDAATRAKPLDRLLIALDAAELL